MSDFEKAIINFEEAIIKAAVEDDSPSPPGDTILAFLSEREDLNKMSLSRRLGMSCHNLNRLISAELELTGEIARKLAEVFGLPAAFWVAREKAYREKVKKEADSVSEAAALRLSAFKGRRAALIEAHCALKAKCRGDWKQKTVLLRGTSQSLIRKSAQSVRLYTLICAFVEGYPYERVEPNSRGISRNLAQQMWSILGGTSVYKIQSWARARVVPPDEAHEWLKASRSALGIGAVILKKDVLLGMKDELLELKAELSRLREVNKSLREEIVVADDNALKTGAELENVDDERSDLSLKYEFTRAKLRLTVDLLRHFSRKWPDTVPKDVLAVTSPLDCSKYVVPSEVLLKDQVSWSSMSLKMKAQRDDYEMLGVECELVPWLDLMDDGILVASENILQDAFALFHQEEASLRSQMHHCSSEATVFRFYKSDS